MRTIVLTAAFTLMISLTGCAEDQFVGGDESLGQAGTEPWGSTPRAARVAADGLGTCPTGDALPQRASDAIVGSWGYISSTIWETGGAEPTVVGTSGNLDLTADGRWTGA